jgi:hypothetical protein
MSTGDDKRGEKNENVEELCGWILRVVVTPTFQENMIKPSQQLIRSHGVAVM